MLFNVYCTVSCLIKHKSVKYDEIVCRNAISAHIHNNLKRKKKPATNDTSNPHIYRSKDRKKQYKKTNETHT